MLESDVQSLRRQRGTEPWWENGLPATAGWNASHFLKANHSPWKVKSPSLSLCGLGLYEAYFTDGENRNRYFKIRENWEEYRPVTTSNQWLQYQTYDVTAQMQREGVLSVLLGNGGTRRFGAQSDRTERIYGDE